MGDGPHLARTDLGSLLPLHRAWTPMLSSQTRIVLSPTCPVEQPDYPDLFFFFVLETEKFIVLLRHSR